MTRYKFKSIVVRVVTTEFNEGFFSASDIWMTILRKGIKVSRNTVVRALQEMILEGILTVHGQGREYQLCLV